MSRAISYTAEQRQLLKASSGKKQLFCAGVETGTEWAEQRGLLPSPLASKLFLFATYLYKGKSPNKAFDLAFGDVT